MEDTETGSEVTNLRKEKSSAKLLVKRASQKVQKTTGEVTQKFKQGTSKVATEVQGQNFQQRCSMIFSALFEMYKALTASLLIIFVTQECADGECSMAENMQTDDTKSAAWQQLYHAGLAFNFATLCVFTSMYLLEIKREQYLIEYLEENPAAKIDNDSVGAALKYLDTDKLSTILVIEKWYKRIGAFAIIMYLTNIVVSVLVIQHHSAGYYTWFSLLTLVLFIAKKFIATYYLIRADSNIYLSAYLSNPLQYNDVDPDYKRDTPVEDGENKLPPSSAGEDAV